MESEEFKGLSEEEHKKLAKQVLRQILHHIDQVDNIHGRGREIMIMGIELDRFLKVLQGIQGGKYMGLDKDIGEIKGDWIFDGLVLKF